MNLFIRTSGGRIIARADSTRNKDKGEIYFPDTVTRIGYSPVVFCHMDRTGKAIGRKFVSRYYDLFSIGILLYPSASGGDFSLAEASCYDHSSVLPLEMFPPEILQAEQDSFFRIRTDEGCIFEAGCGTMKEKLEAAIVECSVPATIHKGDFVLAELEDIRLIHDCSDKPLRITTEFRGTTLSDICLK